MYANFIGIDGSGKDTIYSRIIKDFPNALRTYEPGGTPEADQIRFLLLQPNLTSEQFFCEIQNLLEKVTPLCRSYLEKAFSNFSNEGMSARTEMFLFAASRAQTNETVLMPARKNGTPILGRRSVACSVAYQGAGRGIGLIEVWNENYPAVSFCLPDFEIFFSVPVSEALKRIEQRAEDKNRLDQLSREFYETADQGYREYYKKICPYPYYFVDASKSIEKVEESVRLILKKEGFS